MILENKKGTTLAYDKWFELDTPVDLTDYKYLKAEIYSPTADNAANRKIGINFLNSDWESVGEASTISITDTIYAEIKNPVSGKREVKIVQFFAQNTTDWSTIDGITVNVKKVTATNTKE